jgi:hypothetical protein
VLDISALLELADFQCCRCGQPGAVTFGDLAGLEAFCSPRALRPNAGVQQMARFGIGTVNPADLMPFGPCHRTCPGERPVQRNRPMTSCDQWAKTRRGSAADGGPDFKLDGDRLARMPIDLMIAPSSMSGSQEQSL